MGRIVFDSLNHHIRRENPLTQSGSIAIIINSNSSADLDAATTSNNPRDEFSRSSVHHHLPQKVSSNPREDHKGSRRRKPRNKWWNFLLMVWGSYPVFLAFEQNDFP